MKSLQRAPDMVLRDLAHLLPGSHVRNGPSGFPILFYQHSRVLWKPHRGWFEVYSGHRDSGANQPAVFRDDASVVLHLEGLAPKAILPKCPYCGCDSVLKDRSEVDGSVSNGRKLYVCAQFPVCDAYVGAAPDSYEPLGTLANKALRGLRQAVHKALDPLWHGKAAVTRTQVYAIASEVLSTSQFHIGQADEAMCHSILEQLGEIELRVFQQSSTGGARTAARLAQSTLPLF